MIYIDSSGNFVEGNSKQDKLLKWLYSSVIGRMILKPLVSKTASELVGKFMDSSLSKPLIYFALKKNSINLDDYELLKYNSYNELFTRKIKSEIRMINSGDGFLTSPCDGKISVYPINKSSVFTIKNTKYSVKTLLKSQYLADKYDGGYIIILRLTVDDYHRFCYPANGIKGVNYLIKGKLHTANPIANDNIKIYSENTRTYTMLKTYNFGDIIQMEVGALCVGRIINYHEKKTVKRGEEKGRFEFGGSTVILLTEKNKVNIKKSLIKNTSDGFETLIKMNEIIGEKTN